MYFVEKTKRSLIRCFDYTLFFSVVILSLLGLFVLRSATMTMQNQSRMMLIQTIAIILGVLLAIAISLVDYKFLKDIGIFLYWGSILLLIYVFIDGYGEKLGSKSWFDLFGVVSVQPSEIAKVTFIISLSIYMERLKEEAGKNNLLKLFIHAALPIGLVLLQRDFGTSMVFVVILAVMLFVWGIRFKYIIMAGGAMLLSMPVLWFFVLNERRKSRIIEFLSPGFDPSDASYQMDRARMAIGSGQWFGQGIGKGLQTQSGGVPVKESDFIFSVIGEELGFIGASFVVILVFIILFRCLYVARTSKDYFGEYLAAGVTGMFAFHYFENIGMNIGMLPVTGIPLPFVSQGGTAMIAYYIAIGIVLSISTRRKKIMFSS